MDETESERRERLDREWRTFLQGKYESAVDGMEWCRDAYLDHEKSKLDAEARWSERYGCLCDLRGVTCMHKF